MLDFSSFVEAIHNAITKANDTLMDDNVGLIDKYFVVSDDDNKKMVPRSVNLEYPHLNADGKVEPTTVQVPLITLIPLSTTQIEKAVLSAEFEIDVVNDQLQVDFTSKPRPNPGFFGKPVHEPRRSTLEITITPQTTSEGLKILVEGYERMLKRQFS